LHPASGAAGTESGYAGDECQQLAGGCVDAHGTGLLLQAMTPAAPEVSLRRPSRSSTFSILAGVYKEDPSLV
jgi:hypothetical protein